MVVVERITEEAEADKNLLEQLWRQERAPGPPPEDHRGGALGGDRHCSGDGQSIDAQAGPAGRREDLGVPA